MFSPSPIPCVDNNTLNNHPLIIPYLKAEFKYTHSTSWCTSSSGYEIDVTISQYYIITEGIVQRPLFNITCDLKLWVWVWCHYEPILHHTWRHSSEIFIQHHSWPQTVGMSFLNLLCNKGHFDECRNTQGSRNCVFVDCVKHLTSTSTLRCRIPSIWSKFLDIIWCIFYNFSHINQEGVLSPIVNRDTSIEVVKEHDQWRYTKRDITWSRSSGWG